MSKYRLDKITNDINSSKIDMLPNGMLKIKASLTRTGVFLYRNLDGSVIREYRPPSEVFKADSLKSLELAPLTLYHPPEFVTADNYNEYSVGSVSSIHRDGRFVNGEVLVASKNAIDALDDGIRELSCGYTCDVVHEPGVIDGVEYDAIQKNIIYNHVAEVPKGRAGPDVSFHLDSVSCNYKVGVMMPQEKEDSGLQAALDTAQAKCDSLTEDHKAAEQRCDALETELNTLKQENQEMQTKIDSLQDLESNFLSRVADRVSLEKAVSDLVPEETKLDSMSEIEIHKLVILGQTPSADLEGKSDVYLKARFDHIIESNPKAASIDTRDVVDSVKEDSTPSANDKIEQARAAFYARRAKGEI